MEFSLLPDVSSSGSLLPKLLAPSQQRPRTAVVPNYFGADCGLDREKVRNQAGQTGFPTEIRGTDMSVWFKDEAFPALLESAVEIAWDYLERAGEIDDPVEAHRFLIEKVAFMISQGQHNRLMLSNRAISAFQQYKHARTIELSLISQ
ncbi:hypothetical protein [Bradyrhizobium sp. USDA 10063]